MQRTAIVLFVLLVSWACGGSSPTASQSPKIVASPTTSASPPPTPVVTANPALTIFDRSEAVMLNLSYTVHRQWLKPQQQTLAPVQWKPGQAPETTVVAIDSPTYAFFSTTDTSPHCPNTICYVVRAAGPQRGSSPSCTPQVLINTDVYI